MNWFHRAMTEKCYEPVKRNHDGLRYHGHRFPIKGGISLREVMLRSYAEQPLPSQWERLFAKSNAALK